MVLQSGLELRDFSHRGTPACYHVYIKKIWASGIVALALIGKSISYHGRTI
jgi:hypothetical protein